MRLDFGAWWLAWYDSTNDRIYHHCYEPNTQAFILQFLKPGMVAFDLGAHHGFYALLMAFCVGTTGKVIAFEPSPKERRKLVWHPKVIGVAIVKGDHYGSIGHLSFQQSIDKFRKADGHKFLRQHFQLFGEPLWAHPKPARRIGQISDTMVTKDNRPPLSHKSPLQLPPYPAQP